MTRPSPRRADRAPGRCRTPHAALSLPRGEGNVRGGRCGFCLAADTHRPSLLSLRTTDYGPRTSLRTNRVRAADIVGLVVGDVGHREGVEANLGIRSEGESAAALTTARAVGSVVCHDAVVQTDRSPIETIDIHAAASGVAPRGVIIVALVVHVAELLGRTSLADQNAVVL